MKHLLFFVLLSGIALGACAQPKSPAATAKGKYASVKYSAPQKKGREIFGALVPYGKIWRTGADSTTYITFNRNVTVGGKPVAAGSYSLFTIPSQDQWTVVLNSAPRAWGAYSYDDSKDVVRINVPTRNDAAASEALTLRFEPAGKGEHLVIAWDKTSVAVPIEAR